MLRCLFAGSFGQKPFPNAVQDPSLGDGAQSNAYKIAAEIRLVPSSDFTASGRSFHVGK